jgi:hypothetical protein
MNTIPLVVQLSADWFKKRHDEICTDVSDCDCGEGLTRAGSATYNPDPLVLDLDRDGSIELTNEVYFDLDANGFAESTAWIDSSDGFLAMDRNGNGLIEDGAELFGDHTVKSNGNLATGGFDALADLDSNSDGLIDANDAAFSQLKILTDADDDGTFNKNEFVTLDEAGITGIDLSSGSLNWSDGAFNALHGGR